MKKIFLLIAIMILLNGCATSNGNHIVNNCNTVAAYDAGINDARNHIVMNPNFVSSCPGDQTQIITAYRHGYQFAFAGSDWGYYYPTISPNINGVYGGSGRPSCSYGCRTGMDGVTLCEPAPGQRCMTDNWGNVFCGYACVKSGYGVRCSGFPGDNCVKNNFNDMKCGINCRVEYGEIICAVERYNPPNCYCG